LGADPEASAADAKIGSAAAAAAVAVAVAKQITPRKCRLDFRCANSLPLNAHAREWRVSTGVLADFHFCSL
jgi:hypothetical protein